MDIRSNRHLWFNYFVSFVYSVEETNKATRKKIEKTSMAKKFKDIQSDLAAAREWIRQSDELYKKREAEYQATIAAMQQRIEELEGTQKQLSQMYVSVAFCQFCVSKPWKGEWPGW